MEKLMVLGHSVREEVSVGSVSACSTLLRRIAHYRAI